MNIIKRNNCVISGESDLEPLYTFPQFPVFMGCTNQPQAADIRADMAWSISRGSGMIQLNELLPLDILYPESHGAGAIGALWTKHHKSFANFVAKANPAAVLEIGGAHGILAKEFSAFKEIDWTIIEPNPSPIEGCKARFIKGFFSDKFVFDGKFDTIVHSHVFEHIYDPSQFMLHISKFMKDGQHLIFSLPHMKIMLERKYTNCINFEHTTFLTEDYIEFLLAKYGFKLLAKEYFMDDHSIFYSAVRDSSVKNFELSPNLYNQNKNIYLEYLKYHEELIDNLNKKIATIDQPIYLFGAHVFSQYLIAFGLDCKRIVSLLDNDPNKRGKRLYGTNLMVESPQALKDVTNPIIILKAGVYNQEIKDDILNNINKSTTFLE